MYPSIIELMDVTSDTEDIDWLVKALQWAVEIEMFTLPPYLCARWSIMEDGGTATDRMTTIARHEMNHLGWVANILAGIGFEPQMRDTPERRVVPDYRCYEDPPGGRLPGGVHADVLVTLGALTDAQLKLFMTIEEPETPLPRSLDGRVTIGMFYERIMRVLKRLRPPFSLDGQLSDVGKTFANADAALAALDQIAKEGEGRSDCPYYKNKLTHHYVFGEIFHRKTFTEYEPGKWWYVQPEVPFPRRVATLSGPAAPDDPGNIKFNRTYSAMLSLLHAAWNGGGSAEFRRSVRVMEQLREQARAVMATGVWPTFRYIRD